MDHAIAALKSHLYANEDAYRMGYTTKEEIKAYVKAINVLEECYHGEKQTDLETVLKRW